MAQAFLLSLTRPLEGHQIFHITSNDILAEQPTDELLERWFPNVPRHIAPGEAYWSLIDGHRAASRLGYLPRYHWAEVLGVIRPGEEHRRADEQEGTL